MNDVVGSGYLRDESVVRNRFSISTLTGDFVNRTGYFSERMYEFSVPSACSSEMIGLSQGLRLLCTADDLTRFLDRGDALLGDGMA